MSTGSPPSEYFPNINYNYSFWSSGKDFVTKEYVDNNFLKAVGYSYSRAISTSFSGIIYALGGIETTFIIATGDISANNFKGSGARLTSLNASNVSTGTLSVARGGTGSSTLPLLEVLLGNGTDPIFSTPLLRWDDTTDTLFSKFAGSGGLLTSLDADNISNGTLPVDFGGTGNNFFTGGRLLIGNGTGPITQSGNLSFDGTTNIFTALNIAGNGSRLTNLNVSNASDGTLTVARGGTGATTFTAGRLLIGNGASAITEDPELTWNGTTNVLTVSGTGAITTVSATNIGIGITNPTTSSIEIVRPVTTATDLINMRYDATNGLRFQQAYVAANDVKYNIIQKSNNVDVNAITFYKGAVGLQINGYGVTNSHMAAGSLAIGNITQNYGGGTGSWNTNTAGLLLECADNTEIAIHDANTSIHSFMYYTTNGNFRIGRNMGHGLANVTFSNNATVDNNLVVGGSAGIVGTSQFTGNVGIGKTASTTYKLDVNGSLNATTFFLNGTAFTGNSQWNTGTDTTEIFYNVGNVGIGTDNPTALLDLVKPTAAAVATDLINMRFNNDWGLKLQQNYTGAGNIQYDFIHRYSSVNYNVLTFKGANVGIGTTDPGTFRLNVNGNLNAGIITSTGDVCNGNSYINNVLGFSSLYNGSGANFPCNKINLWNYPTVQYGFGISAGTLDYFTSSTHRFFTGTDGANFGTERMSITSTGVVSIPGTMSCNNGRCSGDLEVGGNRLMVRGTSPTLYLRDTDNRSSMIHCNGEFLYILCASGNDSETWTIQANGAWPFYIALNNNSAYFGGQINAWFVSVGMTGTDYLCVQQNYTNGQFTPNWIRVAFGSFTAFHRCYTDDVLYNNTTDEDIDLFKNKYIGRVVIASGKIKTDLSRPKETDQEPKLDPLTGLPIPENKEEEWYTGIDKDGISIEDAIPVVALSRKKKDKRVFGVLGDPKRNTNNNNRLIVNSIGEGGICVSNTNGNIENGDYIQSSDLLGYGEKQDDDLLHNYTIAKSTIDCNFELDSPYYQCHEIENGIRVAFIACSYHCG